MQQEEILRRDGSGILVTPTIALSPVTTSTLPCITRQGGAETSVGLQRPVFISTHVSLGRTGRRQVPYRRT